MRWGWWRRWWRGRSAPAAPTREVVLYTRQGCHLCEDAWALLERTRRRYGFTLRQVDVDTDPDLAARHGLEVPVVAIDGRVRFRGVVNPVLLERMLRAGGGA
jgi:glutaredoxin